MRSSCVYCFVSSRSGVVFIQNADAITDHSQSTKDIDPYFKSQLYMEDLGHRKPELILPIWLSKPSERALYRKFNFCRGWDSNHNLLNDSPSMLPMSYLNDLISRLNFANGHFKVNCRIKIIVQSH